MPDWLRELIKTGAVGIVGGAVLGALLGFIASQWQTRQQTLARRALLFGLLSVQMQRLPGTIIGPDSDLDFDNVRMNLPETHVSAAQSLLNSDALDWKQHSELARLVIVYQSLESTYNGTVRNGNLAQMLGAFDGDDLREWMDSAAFSYRLLILARRAVLKAMPAEYQPSDWEALDAAPPMSVKQTEDGHTIRFGETVYPNP